MSTNNGMTLTIKSNKNLLSMSSPDKINTALKLIGEKIQTYAKEDCPVDTGRLRNSITYKVDSSEKSVYVGTNVEYAPTVEFRDIRHRNGKAHFLRDAAATHGDEYSKLLEAALKS